MAEGDLQGVRLLAEQEIGHPMCASKLAEILISRNFAYLAGRILPIDNLKRTGSGPRNTLKDAKKIGIIN